MNTNTYMVQLRYKDSCSTQMWHSKLNYKEEPGNPQISGHRILWNHQKSWFQQQLSTHTIATHLFVHPVYQLFAAKRTLLHKVLHPLALSLVNLVVCNFTTPMPLLWYKGVSTFLLILCYAKTCHYINVKQTVILYFLKILQLWLVGYLLYIQILSRHWKIHHHIARDINNPI